MNKIELYNNIVKIYKKSGQGTSGFIRHKIGYELVDELIADGLVKIVTHQYNYLPNDEWICLTKGYCVEDDILVEGDQSALTYVRMYLDVDPIVVIGKDKLLVKDAFRNPVLVEGYSKWLTKNKEKLDEGQAIELLEDSGDSNILSVSDVEYLKTRAWYKENQTIGICLKQLGEYNVTEQVNVLTELIELKQNPKVSHLYVESVKEDIEELELVKKCVPIRKRIKKWLLIQNSNEKIQSVI